MKKIVTKLGVGFGLALAMPGVAMAQTAPKPVLLVPADSDAARLAVATLVVEQIWPLGTYQRIMDTAFEDVVNSMFAGIYDLPVDSFAKAAGVDGTETAAIGDKTMREIMLEADPAFEERMRITMRVMSEEMKPLMAEMEPGIRESLAATYARRFTTMQLLELRTFFDTPTGKLYASESMMLMMSPEMMKSMQAFMPKMVQHMPAIMAKVQEATKHLPPVKRRESGTE